METAKVDPQIWLHNFTQSVSFLIKSEIKDGYRVKGVIISRFLFDKMTQVLGYEPNSICGYVLEVYAESDFEFINETEIDDEDAYGQNDIDGFISIRSEPIN